MTEPDKENSKIDFTKVTASGKRAATEIANTLKHEDPELLANAIQNWLPDVVALVVDVVLSKAKAWEAIDKHESLKFLRELNFQQIFQNETSVAAPDWYSFQQMLVNLENTQYSMVEKLNTVLTVNETAETHTGTVDDGERKKLNLCHHFIHKYGNRLKAALKTSAEEGHPPDLANISFFDLVKSNRGTVLMDLLSIQEQPNPDLWKHYECWFNTAKVSSSSILKHVNSEVLKLFIGRI